ncbi:nucleotidyl transferase AbiEii/AbiGii toxin family protein [Pleionea sp. CnH1-48]|uniref:nucleotidyl transferase AbiEii/AbiGii toxin family protein n=1 Tax=Pleionea sp. CnH1-48 TaxID=2954494 RepID=UPI002096D210|nr:nucleotidyl transferase AbiEii/AbiGii toxin family protein [Pleionea sp. CnH1-48]MCO7223187.1 nucleotidyl transferase AbiEii/AbiGii toxin family protein [Pleionea sp. CnH1-48]
MTLSESSLQSLAIELFYYGLSCHELGQQSIVRGSFVTQRWIAPIPRRCNDADLLIETLDTPKLTRQLGEIIQRMNKHQNVIQFMAEQISVEPIWVDSPAPGVRYLLPYALQRAGKPEPALSLQTHCLQVDIATGDPLLCPAVDFFTRVEVPEACTIRLKTVVPEIAAAWKLHGLFEHLHGGWQPKTLWDLYCILISQNINAQQFHDAITLAFSSRMDPIDIVKRLLFGDFGQSKHSRRNWRKFVENSGDDEYLAMTSKEEVIHLVREHLLPILSLEDDGSLLTSKAVIDFRLGQLREMNTDAARTKLSTWKRSKTRWLKQAYHSIPHLPSSRTGPADRHIDHHKASMLLQRAVHPDDIIIVQEKLDGSCVSALRTDNDVIALGRDGTDARESLNVGRRLWADWMDEHKARFEQLLLPGERVVGEWLALVHGTHYQLAHEPFVPFDIFTSDNQKIPYAELKVRAQDAEFSLPKTLHHGGPCSIEKALELLGDGHHGAVEAPEGAVWRLERGNRVLFLAKYVRHDKVDGCFLSDETGLPDRWNWHSDPSMLTKPWLSSG